MSRIKPEKHVQGYDLHEFDTDAPRECFPFFLRHILSLSSVLGPVVTPASDLSSRTEHQRKGCLDHTYPCNFNRQSSRAASIFQPTLIHSYPLQAPNPHPPAKRHDPYSRFAFALQLFDHNLITFPHFNLLAFLIFDFVKVSPVPAEEPL